MGVGSGKSKDRMQVSLLCSKQGLALALDMDGEP